MQFPNGPNLRPHPFWFRFMMSIMTIWMSVGRTSHCTPYSISPNPLSLKYKWGPLNCKGWLQLLLPTKFWSKLYLNISTEITYIVQLHPLHNSQSIISSEIHLKMHSNSNEIRSEVTKVKSTNYSVLAINGHSDHISKCNWIGYISPEKNFIQIVHIAGIKQNKTKRKVKQKPKWELIKSRTFTCLCRM